MPNKEASISKVFGSETLQKSAAACLEILGMYGSLGRDEKWAPLKGRMQEHWMITFSHKIAAGTSEVQRNIIAGVGWDCPGDRRLPALREIMEEVFVHRDNSNIFIEAQRIAEERNEHVDARYRVRIRFENMLRLAHADRPMRKAIAAGSVPPELRQLWNRMEHQGVRVELFNRIRSDLGEQEIPDQRLQLEMMKDALIWADDPGIVVLLTGDGAGYLEGVGFQSALELMRQRGWRVEVLSWAHSCNFRMRQWVEQNGVFVALDDFYDSITFLEPSTPGHRLAESRDSVPLDLSARATA